MLGAIIIAMQNGIARGIFSNEAGLGSAPIAAAAAQTKEPVRQGLVSMTGTFLDTIVVCSMTGLALVMTGALPDPGPGRRRRHHGRVPERACRSSPARWCRSCSWLCLALFGFTTILGWDYYGERCLEYFSNGNMKAVKVYRWLYICRRVHRPLHDRGRRVDHRRHLQRAAWPSPNMHRARRAFGRRGEGDPQDFFDALGCRRRRRRRHGEASVPISRTGRFRPSTRWTSRTRFRCAKRRLGQVAHVVTCLGEGGFAARRMRPAWVQAAVLLGRQPQPAAHNLPGRRPDSPGRWLQPLSPAAPAYDSAAFSFRTSAASWSFSFCVRHDSVSSANRRC